MWDEPRNPSLDAIVEKALALETGTRGLQRLVGRAVDAVDRRWPELANAGYTRVVIDRACVEGSGDPKLERGGTPFKGASTGSCER